MGTLTAPVQKFATVLARCTVMETVSNEHYKDTMEEMFFLYDKKILPDMYVKGNIQSFGLL